jgi:hypothetical protein
MKDIPVGITMCLIISDNRLPSTFDDDFHLNHELLDLRPRPVMIMANPAIVTEKNDKFPFIQALIHVYFYHRDAEIAMSGPGSLIPVGVRH